MIATMRCRGADCKHQHVIGRHLVEHCRIRPGLGERCLRQLIYGEHDHRDDTEGRDVQPGAEPRGRALGGNLRQREYQREGRDHLPAELHRAKNGGIEPGQMAKRLRAEADKQPEQRDRPGDEVAARRAEAAREHDAAADRGDDRANAGDDQ